MATAARLRTPIYAAMRRLYLHVAFTLNVLRLVSRPSATNRFDSTIHDPLIDRDPLTNHPSCMAPSGAPTSSPQHCSTGFALLAFHPRLTLLAPAIGQRPAPL